MMDYEGYVQAQYGEALDYAQENVSEIDVILEAVSIFKGNPDNSDIEAMEKALGDLVDFVSAIEDMIKYGKKVHDHTEKREMKWERDF